LFEAIGYLPDTYTLAVGGGEFENRRRYGDMAGFVWILKPEEVIPSRKIQAYFYVEGQGYPEAVTSLAVSPDGKRVATGTRTGEGNPPDQLVTASVHVVDLDDGALLGRPLDGLKFGEQKGLQYAPNGSYLIVGHCNNNDKTIHVIDGHTLNVIDRVPAGGTTYDITVNSRAPHSQQEWISRLSCGRCRKPVRSG
jgi:WD40 repeat protein